MRISDWSSDVCSSDLNRSLEKVARYLNLLAAGGIRPDAGDIVAVVHGPATPIVAINPDNPNLALIAALQEAGVTVAICSQAMNRAELSAADLAPGVRVDAAAIPTHRKGVGVGKRGSVRVELGG